MIALEDIESGTELPSLEAGEITRATLALFAGASGDHNPIHIDSDVAKSAGMPDVFAQGMLSMAYLARLLTDWVPQERIRTFEAKFNAITPVHASPVCTGRVVSIDSVGDERLATLDIQVALADGTVTLSGSATIALD